tara:strand:+ start:4428 stop:5690 length:1263 start_codon:yes stop_codon:yes gene_type:complete
MSYHDIEPGEIEALLETAGRLKISSFKMDLTKMPQTQTTRPFEVRGTVGCEFVAFICQVGTIKYYDFVNQVFTDGHVSNSNNLVVSMNTKKYSGQIIFPSGGGTFIFTIIPLNKTKLSGRSTILVKKIEKQSNDATVTFKAGTTNANSYATFPTSTSTEPLATATQIEFNWDITNASSDAGGFGLIPTGDWKNLNSFTDLWYCTTTETVDGAIDANSDHGGYIVKVDDLTDIGLGSYISSVSGGDLDGLPVVRGINTETKEIELSIPQVFADGITLTFRAYGAKAINHAIGVRFESKFNLLDQGVFGVTNLLTKTIRAGSSGTTINLNGTYGVGHNDTQTSISGVGITTASVVSVAASANAGSFVASVSQDALTAGTPIYFTGIVQVFNVRGFIELFNHPATNKTILLDVDKFLTPATAS